MRTVIWSHEAFNDYDKNIEYLLNHWTLKEVINFEVLVKEKIEQLKQMPLSSETSVISGVRKAVIMKQIILYYSITNSRIELLRFWNSYKDPKGLNL